MIIKDRESLCLIHPPELTSLSYPDDLIIRSTFNDGLIQHLKNFLISGEKIYSLTGHGLFVRLIESSEARLFSLYQIVNAYRYSWNGQRINFQCGVSYTTGNTNSKTAIFIFNLLSNKIYHSLKNKCPEPVHLDDY